jgi:NADH:ubiquinone oxidoreductase subunit F (NADH-binding)
MSGGVPSVRAFGVTGKQGIAMDNVTVTSSALPSEPKRTLADYSQGAGLDALARALQIGAEATIEAVASAGVRGRGGAGFPTGRKWQSLRGAIGENDTGFIVVNAAEGEPGTFKDRPLLRDNPFLVLEGALIAAHTLNAHRIVVATKAKYRDVLATIYAAVEELRYERFLDEVVVEVVEGPDAYLFGEETAMLEVIEGEEPLPRHLPPYDYGLFTTSPQLGWSAGSDQSASGPTVESANPALVNNAETLAHVALVLRNGSDWYRQMGTKESPGPAIVTISGDVQRSISAEISLGTSLRSVINILAGGVRDEHSIKAVMSGVSNRVLTAEALDAPVSYEGLAAVGGGLGSAGFIVFDDTRNMVDVAYQALRFLHVESCGQCNPCKTGTASMAIGLEELVFGTKPLSRVIDSIARSVSTVADGGRCYLPTQSQLLITSILESFPADVEERRDHGGDPTLVLPKIVDIVDGRAVVDHTHTHRRPDWSVAESPVWLNR